MELFEAIGKQQELESLSKERLIERVEILENECTRLVKELYEFRQQKLSEEQLRIILGEQISQLRGELYGSKSERYKKPVKDKEEKSDPKPRIKKPSERYPNVPVREQVIGGEAPQCEVCGEQMVDSGLREESEQLTVIPKRYEIVRTQRVKYRCSCQGCMKTEPMPARILPGSSYSDEMIVDVALSKYCDLIPVQRYVSMAGRNGLRGLPAHSLIETTHALADFYRPVYELLKEGVLASRVLHADETPHKMLEGSKTKGWYLWGFANTKHSYFECHPTRSADVASEILKRAACEYLISDVYSGYSKATREANKHRLREEKKPISNVYCNAHARRYFFKCWQSKYKSAEFYLEHYHEIYQLYGQEKNKAPPDIIELRSQMKPHFEAMKERASEELPGYSSKNQYAKALKYFLGNYVGLTIFLEEPVLPPDNNLQERLLRSPVVGRKTWYGTHSKLGAKTTAILFSIVESCKLNGVNPREFFRVCSQDLLNGKLPYTPFEFLSRS